MKFKIPCSYQGGKDRLAKQIVDIILKENEFLLDEDDDRRFYDLCCGSGAISIEMINRGVNPIKIVMVDASPWGLFYEKIGEGYFSTEVFQYYLDDIPKDLSKVKSYCQLVLSESANTGLLEDAVYKFLILQACSFGGTATWIENNQWKKSGGLRNYWLPTETSNRRSPVNPMMPLPKTLFDRVEHISAGMDSIQGIYGKVEDVKIDEDAVVYIDPPYEGTHGYGYEFDYMNFVKSINNKAYISEGKSLSDNGICLSKGRAKGNINGNKNKKPTEEWLSIFN